MFTNSLLNMVLMWVALSIFIVLHQWYKRRSGGLILVMLTLLTVNHFVSAALNCLPRFSGTDLEATELGFEATLMALASLVAGDVLVTFFLLPKFQEIGNRETAEPLFNSTFANFYVLVGVGNYFFFYFFLLPVFGFIPTLTAILSNGFPLFVVGVNLHCFQAWKHKSNGKIVGWFLLASLFPLFTVSQQGFLGSGITILLSIICFLLTFYRPRWVLFASLLLVGFLGLSVYVTYMRERGIIRSQLGEGDATEKLVRVVTLFSDFEFFEIQNDRHLNYVEDRLNQNLMVGSAVRYLNTGAQEFAEGDTLLQAFYALVPRVLWPDKPYVAGSSAYATLYTGKEFAEGTSVGLGTILELYINFAYTGVVIGYFLLGVIISLADYGVASSISEGNFQKFALYYLPTLNLIIGGSMFAETLVSAISSVVLVLAINWFFRFLFQPQSTPQTLEGDR